MEVCEIEGFSLRNCEDDEGVVDEPLVQVKKDDKKGAKKPGKKWEEYSLFFIKKKLNKLLLNFSTNSFRVDNVVFKIL